MAGGFEPPQGAPQWGQNLQWNQAYQWHQGRAGHALPGGQVSPWGSAEPLPRLERGPRLGPIILISLGLIGLVFLGLILYAVLSGPAYQHDDYIPPAPGNVKPPPDVGGASTQDLLERNPLYAQTVPRPVRCELSNPEISIENSTDAELKTHFDELMACNMRVWDQPFSATGQFELVRPKVNIYHQATDTMSRCGRLAEPNAVFCSANEQVYWSRELPEVIPLLKARVGADMVMTHELGHALQYRSGIRTARVSAQEQGDRRTDRELNRRSESQADCFAGMWINSVAESLNFSDDQVLHMIDAMRTLGSEVPAEDDRHGSAATRAYWIQVGMSGSDIARCNTFIAPSELVR